MAVAKVTIHGVTTRVIVSPSAVPDAALRADVDAIDAALSAHVSDTENPHGTTYANLVKFPDGGYPVTHTPVGAEEPGQEGGPPVYWRISDKCYGFHFSFEIYDEFLGTSRYADFPIPSFVGDAAGWANLKIRASVSVIYPNDTAGLAPPPVEVADASGLLRASWVDSATPAPFNGYRRVHIQGCMYDLSALPTWTNPV